MVNTVPGAMGLPGLPAYRSRGALARPPYAVGGSTRSVMLAERLVTFGVSSELAKPDPAPEATNSRRDAEDDVSDEGLGDNPVLIELGGPG